MLNKGESYDYIAVAPVYPDVDTDRPHTALSPSLHTQLLPRLQALSETIPGDRLQPAYCSNDALLRWVAFIFCQLILGFEIVNIS